MVRAGLEPGISGSQGKRSNHWATLPIYGRADIFLTRSSANIQFDDNASKCSFQFTVGTKLPDQSVAQQRLHTNLLHLSFMAVVKSPIAPSVEAVEKFAMT